MRYDSNIGSSHKHCITLYYRHMEAQVCPTLITNLQVHLIMKHCTYQRSIALQYNERT